MPERYKNKYRKLSRERACRMARASWTDAVREKRQGNRSAESLAEDAYRRALRDSRGEVLRRGSVVNVCTGERVEFNVSRGRVRVNQYCLNGEDGLDRRGLAYALLEAMGI